MEAGQLHDDSNDPPLDLLNGEGNQFKSQVILERECFQFREDKKEKAIHLLGSTTLETSASWRIWMISPEAMTIGEKDKNDNRVNIAELPLGFSETCSLEGPIHSPRGAPFGVSTKAFIGNEFIVTPMDDYVIDNELEVTSEYIGVPLYSSLLESTPLEVFNPFYVSWGTREAPEVQSNEPENYLQNNGQIKGEIDELLMLALSSSFEVNIQSNDIDVLTFENATGLFEVKDIYLENVWKASKVEISQANNFSLRIQPRHESNNNVTIIATLDCEAKDIAINGKRINGLLGIYTSKVERLFTNGLLPFLAGAFLSLFAMDIKPPRRKVRKSKK